MIRQSTKFFVLSIILIITLNFKAAAQLSHQPSPGERAVLTKIITAITNILDQFGDKDWDKTSDFYNPDLYVEDDSSVPIDIDQDFNRIYLLNENSDRYLKFVKPLTDQVNERINKKIYDSVTEGLQKQIRRLSSIAVVVFINRQSLPFIPGYGHCDTVNVKDAAFACRVNSSLTASGIPGASYWLGFGNWDSGSWNKDQNEYRFHFSHPAHTPFVENAVIVITGAEDRISELLHSIDWSRIKMALTF
jgi:hypothetical protein